MVKFHQGKMKIFNNLNVSFFSGKRAFHISKVYYQRVLACRTPEIAVKSSLIGIAITFLLGIPPAIIGVIGSAAGEDHFCK